jgi:acyl-CoA thioesterase FadM
MGKVNKLRQVIALTSEITVKYLKPVPLRQPLRVVSREVSVTGRKHTNKAEILNEDGQVLARSQGLFIAIDPTRFAEGTAGASVQASAKKSGGFRVTSA